MKISNALRSVLIFFVLAAVMTSLTAEPEPSHVHLMPWPSDVKLGAGQLAIDTSFSVTGQGSHPRLGKAVTLFLNDLPRPTGMLPLDLAIKASEGASVALHGDHPVHDTQDV